MKTEGFSIGIIFLLFAAVCTNCTKDEDRLSPDGESSVLKSATNDYAKSGWTTSTTGFPMIDLGEGVGYGVNSSGKVVGETFIDVHHACLWDRNGEMKDLGCLGYPELALAVDINDRDQVVGSSWSMGGPDWSGNFRAFLWTDKGGLVDLGTSGDPGPAEQSWSLAWGINNRGEIVGEVSNYGFLWTDNRGMVLLNTQEPLWKLWSLAWDINDHGLIVGTGAPIKDSDEERVYHAKLWTDVGEMLDLGTILERQFSVAMGINNRGEIVGGCNNNVTDIPRNHMGDDFHNSNVAFIWTKQNKMSQLPALIDGDEGFASANAINDLGKVVGWSSTAEGYVHAVVWTGKKGIMDLGTLPGDVESVAYGINNLGQVVGYSKDEWRQKHAVIWTVK